MLILTAVLTTSIIGAVAVSVIYFAGLHPEQNEIFAAVAFGVSVITSLFSLFGPKIFQLVYGKDIRRIAKFGKRVGIETSSKKIPQDILDAIAMMKIDEQFEYCQKRIEEWKLISLRIGEQTLFSSHEFSSHESKEENGKNSSASISQKEANESKTGFYPVRV